MGRSSSIRKILGAGGENVSLKSIQASGDCFYEAIVVGYQTVGKSVLDETRVEDTVRGSPHTVSGDGILALRHVVSDNLTHEVFRLFKMYCDAGLPDFDYMRHIQTIRRLKELMVVKGKTAGAGHCIWANEFEMRVVAKALGLSILIIDDQGRGNGRFVVLDDTERTTSSHSPFRRIETDEDAMKKHLFVILQRTRRQHYNLVLVAGRGLLTLQQLPNTVVDLWSLEDWYTLPNDTHRKTQVLETAQQVQKIDMRCALQPMPVMQTEDAMLVHRRKRTKA